MSNVALAPMRIDLQLEIADFGPSDRGLERPENALRCPTLRPEARKRGLASTTACFCTILGSLPHAYQLSETLYERLRYVV